MVKLILTVAVLLASAGTLAAADPVVFSATNFNDDLWNVTVVYASGSGGAATGWHVDDYGHSGQLDDGWRQCRITLNAGGHSTVWAFHQCTAFGYDPQAQGAVATIDFAAYARQVSGQHDIGPAIRQDGVVYAVTGLFVTEESWTRKMRKGLVESDFHVIGGTATPDFSASGSPFEVGFITGCSTLVEDHGTYEVDTGIDNWTFTVVPEPATMSLLAVGLGAMVIRRRRSSENRPMLRPCLRKEHYREPAAAGGG